ncbi:MAG TPA: hypothetical protein VF789_30735 [Thermoanaerobaculia bacterium]
MADPVKRPRYFNGQLLREEDFNLAQNYLIARDSWHGRQFHSPGVAEGLAVDAGVGASQAKVSPGSGMDSLGRPIVLVEEVLLPLDRLANRTVLVVISYAETPSDPASSGAGDFTRWQERPEVAVVPEGAGAPPESTHLRLARLVLDANSKVKEHDATVRRFAGTRLGNELELRRLVLSREGVASSGWPALTCGAANRVDVGGDLQVGGALTVGPGKSAANAEFNLRFTAHESDFASLQSKVAGGVTALTLSVGDDFEDSINLTTVGWQRGQRGPINLRAGNITLELEAVATRSLSVVDSAAKPLLSVRNDGRVGIGTAEPEGTLEVNSGGADVSPTLGVSTLGREDFFAIYGARRSSQNNDLLWRRGLLRFGTATTFGGQAFSEKMRITEAGNVGVGNVDPGNYRLAIRQSAPDSGLGLRITNPDASKSLQLWVGTGGGVVDAEGSTNLHLRTNGQERLFIQNAGNVGIGNLNPRTRLEVSGDLLLDNGGPDGARLVWWAKDSAEWRARNYFGTLGFFPGEGKPTVLSLTATSVNIGTTLHVGGLSVLAQEAWKAATFQNGWRNYGGPFNNAAYMKDSLGFVHLRGLVKDGGGTIFTLPEGYRPARQELFGVATRENTIGRIDVLVDGQVSMTAGNKDWISLDGITFQAGFTRGFDLGNIDADRFNPNLIPGIRVGPVGPQLPPLP